MHITIDLPDWLINDYEAKTGTKFGKIVAETAARAYYMRLYDPMYNPNLSEATLVAIYGEDLAHHYDLPHYGDPDYATLSDEEMEGCPF